MDRCHDIFGMTLCSNGNIVRKAYRGFLFFQPFSRPAPSRLIAVGISSAFNLPDSRCAAIFDRALLILALGSRKTSTEGPAPLNTAPKMPALPTSFCTAGNNGH